MKDVLCQLSVDSWHLFIRHPLAICVNIDLTFTHPVVQAPTVVEVSRSLNK